MKIPINPDLEQLAAVRVDVGWVFFVKERWSLEVMLSTEYLGAFGIPGGALQTGPMARIYFSPLPKLRLFTDLGVTALVSISPPPIDLFGYSVQGRIGARWAFIDWLGVELEPFEVDRLAVRGLPPVGVYLSAHAGVILSL